MMNFEIKEINYKETLQLRHKVMWPNKPLEYVKLDNDEEGRHFGLFVNQAMISVISYFSIQKEVQFRKFATLSEYQGKGYGTELLKHIFTLVKDRGENKIWCNARSDKTSFYHRFGLKETDEKFNKGGISYVIMEKCF